MRGQKCAVLLAAVPQRTVTVHVKRRDHGVDACDVAAKSLLERAFLLLFVIFQSPPSSALREPYGAGFIAVALASGQNASALTGRLAIVMLLAISCGLVVAVVDFRPAACEAQQPRDN